MSNNGKQIVLTQDTEQPLPTFDRHAVPPETVDRWADAIQRKKDAQRDPMELLTEAIREQTKVLGELRDMMGELRDHIADAATKD